MTGTPTLPKVRFAGLDRIRGVAVLLMVIDHIAAWCIKHVDNTAAIETSMWLRQWPTRLAMPTFMLVSGVLLTKETPTTTRRRTQVALAAVVVNAAILITSPGIAAPEILFIWSLLMVAPVRNLLVEWPLAVAPAAILWAFTWPVQWDTYQPGLVAAYLALGVAIGKTYHWRNPDLGTFLPAWTEVLGRRPLALYVGHILILAALAAIWQVAP